MKKNKGRERTWSTMDVRVHFSLSLSLSPITLEWLFIYLCNSTPCLFILTSREDRYDKKKKVPLTREHCVYGKQRLRQRIQEYGKQVKQTIKRRETKEDRPEQKCRGRAEQRQRRNQKEGRKETKDGGRRGQGCELHIHGS